MSKEELEQYYLDLRISNVIKEFNDLIDSIIKATDINVKKCNLRSK